MLRTVSAVWLRGDRSLSAHAKRLACLSSKMKSGQTGGQQMATKVVKDWTRSIPTSPVTNIHLTHIYTDTTHMVILSVCAKVDEMSIQMGKLRL